MQDNVEAKWWSCFKNQPSSKLFPKPTKLKTFSKTHRAKNFLKNHRAQNFFVCLKSSASACRSFSWGGVRSNAMLVLNRIQTHATVLPPKKKKFGQDLNFAFLPCNTPDPMPSLVTSSCKRWRQAWNVYCLLFDFSPVCVFKCFDFSPDTFCNQKGGNISIFGGNI